MSFSTTPLRTSYGKPVEGLNGFLVGTAAGLQPGTAQSYAYVVATAPASGTQQTYTIPDPGASASFVMTTGNTTITGTITTSGNVTINTVGSGFVQKAGTNGRAGTFVANGASAVTISNTSVAVTDAVIISLNTVGGTVGVQPHVATITAGTGFTVVCTASDTSTYNYSLIGTN
jgi:hypothetical protein